MQLNFLALVGLLNIYSVFVESSKESVPVLIWNSHKAPQDIPAVSALQVIPFTNFQEKYLNSFDTKNVIIFLQDTLSVEDLSSHPEELKYIGNWMETSHSLYLPAVEDAGHLVHALPLHGYNVITLEAGSPVSGIDLKKDANNLVLVKLPPTTTNPSRKMALQKSDEVIENVISKIGKMADFTIIFTGNEPTVANRDIVRHRISRSLNALNRTDTETPHFHQSKCVLLYLRDNLIIYKGNMKYELKENSSAGVDVGNCQDRNSSILIRYKNVDVPDSTIDKVKVEFRFVSNGRFWWLTEVEIFEQHLNTITATLYPKKEMERVPLKKSYACAQQIILSSVNDTTGLRNTQYKMYINGMQVEAFTTATATKFNNGWDCVGFFTIPIWTGILTGILLTFILLFGLYMLGNVKTMDRFDDPKGKNILIIASE